jgi:predicted peptidase
MRHLFLALLLTTGCALPQTDPRLAWSGETGFLNRTVAVDSVLHRYQVYLPADYAPDRPWPVIIFLHGAGERGENGMMQTQVGLGPAIRLHPERWPAVVIFPQLPSDGNWNTSTEPLAIQALDQTMSEFHIDPDRVYLTGLSMGGYGSLFLAGRHPQMFAALVPICPSVGYYRGYPFLHGNHLDASLQGTAEAVRTLPVWLFHGEEDTVFPVEISRSLHHQLDSLGADVRFTSYPGTGHNAWDAAYADSTLIAWLFEQKRPS